MANNGKGLADHFNLTDHQGIHDLLACPIMTLPHPDPQKARNLPQRRHLEGFFMKLLETLPPKGLNKKEDAKQKLIPVEITYGKA